MYQGGPEAVKRQRTESYRMMSDSSDDAGCIPVALDNNAEHFVRMMHGLHKLKKERVLCDVTLIAEGVCFCLFLSESKACRFVQHFMCYYISKAACASNKIK